MKKKIVYCPCGFPQSHPVKHQHEREPSELSPANIKAIQTAKWILEVLTKTGNEEIELDYLLHLYYLGLTPSRASKLILSEINPR